MPKKFLVSFIASLFIFSFVNLALAHNPRLVYNIDALPDKPIIIENPDISQAYYGKLKGWEEYYQFTLTAEQDFYFGTLVPDVKAVDKTISADLINQDDGKIIARLDAGASDWPPYFEKFAGDHYFSGPTSTINLSPGKYSIKIYNNNNNEGKYVLVVGQKEVFTPREIIGTIVNLPALKIYFETSPLNAYFNYVGLFIAGSIIAFLILILIVRFFYRLISRIL
jgi:hypothetical protein